MGTCWVFEFRGKKIPMLGDTCLALFSSSEPDIGINDFSMSYTSACNFQ